MLVVKREHLTPRHAVVGPWDVEGQPLAIPLIPERHRHGILLHEGQLGPHHAEEQCGQPECVALPGRSGDDLAKDEADPGSDQNEDRRGNPRERQGRHELQAVPSRRGDEPTALGDQHGVVGTGRRHDSDAIGLRPHDGDLIQGQHHHRIDRPNRLSLVVQNAHLANDDLAFAVKRIEAQDFERFLRQGEAQRIEGSGTLVQHRQAGIVGTHREVRAPEDLRPAPPLGLELDFEHASARLEQPGARHRHGHQGHDDQAPEQERTARCRSAGSTRSVGVEDRSRDHASMRKSGKSRVRFGL